MNLSTASNVNSLGDYHESSYFERGDDVYIYQENTNINSNDGTTCNLQIDITIESNGTIYHSGTYVEEDLKGYSEYVFTVSESWPLGEYDITVEALDKISNKSSSSMTSFTVVESLSKNLEFLVLETASEVKAYQDYVPEDIFYPNERIYVYGEYTNITLINYELADLSLDFVVRFNGELVLSNFTLKNEVKNNAHKWYFDPDANWTSGAYSITVTIQDNPTSNIISKTIVFTYISSDL